MKIKQVRHDAQGQPVIGPDGQYVLEEVEVFSHDEVKQQVSAKNKAAYDAQKKAEAQAAEARTERERVEAQLAETERKQKEAARAVLPPDQQFVMRLSDMESQLAQERAERAKLAATTKKDMRRLGLVAYRERACRDVPDEVQHLVHGDSEEMIDLSVDFAQKTFDDINAKLEAKFAAAQGLHGPQTIPNNGQYQGQPAPYYQGQPQVYAPPPPQQMIDAQGRVYDVVGRLNQPAQPPPNPHYVPPPPPHVMQQGGFPSFTNPPQIPEVTETDAADFGGMTTEQAVRSGRYSNEMRAKVHAQLRGQNRYPGALGVTPRHGLPAQAPAHHVAQPNGEMQPQGHPTGPVAHPQYQGPPQQQPQYAQPQYAQPPQPQYAPQPQQPVLAPMPVQRAATGADQARAAVARMHAGDSPVIGENIGASEVRQASHAHAQRRGIQSPQQAFGQRFAPTPAIPQN